MLFRSPEGLLGPQPLDYQDAAKGAVPQVGGGRTRPVPPNAKNVARPQAAQLETAPNVKTPDAGDAKTEEAAGRAKKQPATVAAGNRKSGTSQKTAGNTAAARPVKPTRVLNSHGPIVPASGIKPSRDQQGDTSGDKGRPGLIGPS